MNHFLHILGPVDCHTMRKMSLFLLTSKPSYTHSFISSKNTNLTPVKFLILLHICQNGLNIRVYNIYNIYGVYSCTNMWVFIFAAMWCVGLNLSTINLVDDDYIHTKPWYEYTVKFPAISFALSLSLLVCSLRRALKPL